MRKNIPVFAMTQGIISINMFFFAVKIVNRTILVVRCN